MTLLFLPLVIYEKLKNPTSYKNISSKQILITFLNGLLFAFWISGLAYSINYTLIANSYIFCNIYPLIYVFLLNKKYKKTTYLFVFTNIIALILMTYKSRDQINGELVALLSGISGAIYL